MTDSQQGFDQQAVTPSDVTSERELASPAISTSPVQYGGQPGSTNQANPHLLGSGGAAYQTNPYSGAGLDNFAFPTNQAPHVSPGDAALYTTRSPEQLAHSSNPASALGSFGSQSWVSPSPYLSFAPQPIYEPTGELIHEHVQTFDQFDSPPSRQPSQILTAQRALQPAGPAGPVL